MRYAPEDFAEFVEAVPANENGRQHAPSAPLSDRIPEGRRRTELLSLAGAMRRRGAKAPEIIAALTVANDERCETPLDAAEISEMVTDVCARYRPAESHTETAVDTQAKIDCMRSPLTEVANAERLTLKHGEDIRFCSDRGVWCAWEGRYWAVNDFGAITRKMKDSIGDLYVQAAAQSSDEARAAFARWAILSDSRRIIENSIALARYIPGIEVRTFTEVFDRFPTKLNVKNGTIDLCTGELHPHRREDFITKMLPFEYDKAAKCPKFQAFLYETFPQEGMVAYIVQVLGYFLTGLVGDQTWWVWHGETATGKSTLVRIIHLLLGSYAFALPENYFLVNKNGSDFVTANLAGVRFASCVETADGRRLDVPKMKALTGGDRISASLKYQNLFSFTTEAKLVLATNYPPVVPAGDAALWRRLRVLPFSRRPLDPDQRVPDFAEKLVAEEGPGILRLATLGFMQRFECGVSEPDAVVHAGSEYRRDMDSVRHFLAECSTSVPGDRVRRQEFYRRFKEWSEENHAPRISPKRLSLELGRLGIQGDAGDRFWLGLRLNDVFETGDAPSAEV